MPAGEQEEAFRKRPTCLEKGFVGFVGVLRPYSRACLKVSREPNFSVYSVSAWKNYASYELLPRIVDPLMMFH